MATESMINQNNMKPRKNAHIGIDLVAVRRFKKIKKTDYGAWNRVFSEQEWDYAFHDTHSAEHLAGMFAAKEAAMKASGKAGIENLKMFEITHTAECAPRLNKRGYCVSISHDHAYAIAVVLVG